MVCVGVQVEFTTRKTHHIIFILNYCHKQPKSFIINFNGYRHIDILATSIEDTRAVARHNKTRGVDIGSGEVKYGLIWVRKYENYISVCVFVCWWKSLRLFAIVFVVVIESVKLTKEKRPCMHAKRRPSVGTTSRCNRALWHARQQTTWLTPTPAPLQRGHAWAFRKRRGYECASIQMTKIYCWCNFCCFFCISIKQNIMHSSMLSKHIEVCVCVLWRAQ